MLSQAVKLSAWFVNLFNQLPLMELPENNLLLLLLVCNFFCFEMKTHQKLQKCHTGTFHIRIFFCQFVSDIGVKFLVERFEVVNYFGDYLFILRKFHFESFGP